MKREAAQWGLIILLAMVFSPRSVAQIAVDAPEPAAPVTRAKAAIDEGHYAEAEKLLRDHLAQQTSDVEARYLLAFALFRENKPADSLQQYTTAAQARRPTAKDLRTVALDYVLLNDYDDAAHWAHVAVELDGKDPEAWYELGRIEYTRNLFQASVDAFQRALTLDPVSVKAEDNLGLALQALNRTDEAVAAHRKALAMQTGSSRPSEQPFLNLAKLLIDRNQSAEALPLLQQAVKIAPNNWQVLAQLGRLYGESGDTNAAREVLERAVALQPKEAALHFQLGRIYQRTGSTEKANNEFKLTRDLLGTTSTPNSH